MSAVVAALVPPDVVTLACTMPAAVRLGVVTWSWVAEPTLRLVPAVPPNVTLLAPVRLVPVIVTTVPPAKEPFAGLSAVTVGPGVTLTAYVYLSLVVVTLAPPGVVTLASTTPVAVRLGVVTWSWVAEPTLRLVPAVPPNVTLLAPVRLVPVIVTTVPPAKGPLAGLSAVTVGAGTVKTCGCPPPTLAAFSKLIGTLVDILGVVVGPWAPAGDAPADAIKTSTANGATRLSRPDRHPTTTGAPGEGHRDARQRLSTSVPATRTTATA